MGQHQPGRSAPPLAEQPRTFVRHPADQSRWKWKCGAMLPLARVSFRKTCASSDNSTSFDMPYISNGLKCFSNQLQAPACPQYYYDRASITPLVLMSPASPRLVLRMHRKI